MRWRFRACPGALALFPLLLPGCGGGGGGGADTSPPKVIATLPPDGATGVGVDLPIAAIFDEELWPASVDATKLTLADEFGAAVAGTVTYELRTATFVPDAALAWSTQYTAVLHAGVEDLARNALQHDHAWSFTTAANPDATPPEVFATEPPDGATDVDAGASVHAWFSEPMNPATLDGSSFLLSAAGGGPVAGTVEFSGFVATFTPAAPLAPSGLYTATVTTGAEDLNGNPLAADHSWSFRTVSPAPGSLDTSFGSGGIVSTSLTDNNDWATGMVVQPGGRIVVSAITSAGWGAALARYLPDGSLDPSFGFGGSFTTGVMTQALVQQPDGKLVAAGGVWSGSLRFALARFDANGVEDAGFGSNGLVLTPITPGNDLAQAVALQPDGRILALGFAGGTTPVLVRYETNGDLDPQFGTGGILTVPIPSATSLALQPGGKIVVAGRANIPGSHIGLVRFDPSGALDAGFGLGGFAWANLGGTYGDWVGALIALPDGKLVVAGGMGTISGSDSVLLRWTENGGLDPDFGDQGVQVLPASPANDAFSALALQPDGKLLAAGMADLDGLDFLIARVAADGGPDAGFGIGGIVRSDLGSSFDEAFVLAREPLGRILVAGRTLGDTGYDVALARYWP